MELWLQQLLEAFGVGIVCGLIVSVPIGPLSLTVIDHALSRGFRTAFSVGLGGILGEACYATVMLAGHSTILENPMLVHVSRGIALIVITILGIRYLRFQPEKLARSANQAQRIEERWHHPRAFLLGFAITISNLMLLVLWATLAALLVAHEWVGPNHASRAACVSGVFLGGLSWLTLLSYTVARMHRQITPRTLTLLVRSCGAILLIFGAVLAWRLFR